MIKAGIFDIGGVLHKRVNEHIFSDIDKTLQISEDTRKEYWDECAHKLSIGKISELEFWHEFIKSTHAKGKLPKQSLLLREYKNHFEIFRDIMQMVKELKNNGYKVAALSDTNSIHSGYNKKMGIYKVFPIKVLSHEVGMVKPNPEIYLYTLQKLGVAPQEAFFTDDLQKNIDAANKLGIHGILFTSATKLRNKLQDLGVNI